MIEAQNIAIARGTQKLFQNLNFKVQAGEILHIEGENGAGKSTLLRVLLGLCPPDSGQILWHNTPLKRAQNFKENLCYIAHSNAIKEELTPLENLTMNARIAGINLPLKEAVEALDAVQLKNRAYLPAKFLSQGQKRRVALARLFFDSRPLWVLDEPFVALDSKALEWLVGKINQHLEKNGALIFTSHQRIEGILRPMNHLRLESGAFPR